MEFKQIVNYNMEFEKQEQGNWVTVINVEPQRGNSWTNPHQATGTMAYRLGQQTISGSRVLPLQQAD